MAIGWQPVYCLVYCPTLGSRSRAVQPTPVRAGPQAFSWRIVPATALMAGDRCMPQLFKKRATNQPGLETTKDARGLPVPVATMRKRLLLSLYS